MTGRRIHVRNVPEDTHATLRARAAAEDMSVADYVRRLIREDAERPAMTAGVLVDAWTPHAGQPER